MPINLSGIDWIMVGVLLTAFFTGAIFLTTFVFERRRQRENEQRFELKVLLGELMDELTGNLLYNAPADEYDDWISRTARLVDASLGRGEEQWVMEPIPGGAGVSDTEEKRKKLLKKIHLRLQTLMRRMDTISLSPDFDPKQWPPSNSDT